MQRFIILASSFLYSGCSEYEVKARGDGSAGADDTGSSSLVDTGRPDISACDTPEEPPMGTVVLNAECEVGYQEGSFTPVVEWTYGNQLFCGPAVVGQMIDTNGTGFIDSEDTPLVVLYQGGAVVALYGDSGTPAWTSGGGYGSYSSWGGDYGGLALGDVNHDGTPDVITAGLSMVCALDGSTGSQLWCTSGLSGSMDPNGFNYPAIADMNADGQTEVTVGSAIMDGASGALIGRGAYGIGAAPYYTEAGTYGANSVPIDLDGDGQLELVTGNAAYDITGSAIWTNGGRDGLVAIADFDGDGQGEIVKTSGAYVTGMDTDGTELWEVSYAGGAYLAIGTPAIDDLDGDGDPEIVMAVQNDLVAMEWGGSVIWTAGISDYTGAAGPSLFDFEMDGYPEVLYQDEGTIRFFSGLDGSVKYTSSAHSSVTILETPIVADVDGDDQVEIVVSHCGSAHQGVTVFGDADGTWPPGRKIWNQHGYSITNVEENGSISTPTPSNFEVFNSFRSGDVGRPPEEYWDLVSEVLDVCEDECEEGFVYVAARLGNAGNTPVPSGVPISLRAGAGGPIIASKMTYGEIPPGLTGEMVVFRVGAPDIAGKTPVVTADEAIDGLGVIYECEEDNNAETWGQRVCL
jgi:hypothetical protein